MIASRSMRSLIASIPTVVLALMLAAAVQPSEARAAEGSASALGDAETAAARVLSDAAAAQGQAIANAASNSQAVAGSRGGASGSQGSSGSQGAQLTVSAQPASAQPGAAAGTSSQTAASPQNASPQATANSQAPAAEGFTYALNSKGEAAITGYTGTEAQLTIPATLDGHAVVAIADGAFEANATIAGVTVPQGVASIGNRAFADCAQLARVSLPEGLAYLGAGAFSNDDKLTEVTVPATLTSCGAAWGQDGTYGPFGGCDSLARITLAEGSTQVVPNLLLGCASVQSLVLPQSVASVSADAIDARLLSDKKLTVRGVPGSFAQTYAQTAGLAFADSVVHATGVTLDKPSVKTEVGSTTQLTATVEPADHTDSIAWSSSDDTILSVDATGKVTAKAPGSATVTVQVGEVSASCAFEVVQPVTSITLNKKALTLEAAEARALQAVVGPENATNKELVWTSSNEKVATVDAQGRVSTLSKGTATITATAADGYGAKASCTVEVTNTATFATSVEQMASPQGYGNDKDDVWIYRLPDAPSISVTFDGRTAVENGYDFIDVYDAQGRLFGRYTGLELAGKTLVLEGDTVRVKLVTDSSDVLWGFGVTDVSPVETSGWKVVDGITYYYIDGEPARGELLLSDGWHYFNENTGAMITGLVTLPDGRIVYYDPRGVMQKGEVLLADGWHYFRPSDGSMAIGFTVLPDRRCRYYDHRGVMRVGDVYIGGNLYRFDDATGVLVNDVDITDVDVTDVTNITNVQVNVSQTQNNITNVIIQTGDMADDDQEPTPDFDGDDGQGAGTPEDGDGEVGGRPGADGSAEGDGPSSSAEGDRPGASGSHDAMTGAGEDSEAGQDTGESGQPGEAGESDDDADAQGAGGDGLPGEGSENASAARGEEQSEGEQLGDEGGQPGEQGPGKPAGESAMGDASADSDGEVGGAWGAASSRADRSWSSDAAASSDAHDVDVPADDDGAAPDDSADALADATGAAGASSDNGGDAVPGDGTAGESGEAKAPADMTVLGDASTTPAGTETGDTSGGSEASGMPGKPGESQTPADTAAPGDAGASTDAGGAPVDQPSDSSGDSAIPAGPAADGSAAGDSVANDSIAGDQAAGDSAQGDSAIGDTPADDAAANPLHLAMDESGHVTCDLFEFDVPADWIGRVEVGYAPAAEGSGASDAVVLAMAGHHDVVLAEFRIADAATPLAEGDTAHRLVGFWDNGKGQRIEAWQTSYTYQLWEGAQSGASTLALDDAAKAELVDLVSGGSATLDDVYAAADGETAAALSGYAYAVAHSAMVPHFDATGANDGWAPMETPAPKSEGTSADALGASGEDGRPLDGATTPEGTTGDPNAGAGDTVVDLSGVPSDGPVLAPGSGDAFADFVPDDTSAGGEMTSVPDGSGFDGALYDGAQTDILTPAPEGFGSDSTAFAPDSGVTSPVDGIPADGVGSLDSHDVPSADSSVSPDMTAPADDAAPGSEGTYAGDATPAPDGSASGVTLPLDGTGSADGGVLGIDSAPAGMPADAPVSDVPADVTSLEAPAADPTLSGEPATDASAGAAASTPLELEAAQREKIEAMVATYIAAVVDDTGATSKTGNLVTTPGAPGAIDTALVVSTLDLVTPNLGTYAGKSTTLTAPNPLNLQVTTAEDGTHIPLATARTILTSFYGSCPDDLSYLGTAAEGFTGMVFTGEEWIVAPVAPGTATFTMRAANYASTPEGVISFDCRMTFTTGDPAAMPVDKYYHVTVTPDAQSVFGYHMTSAEEVAPVPALA